MQGEYQHRFQQAESQCTVKRLISFPCFINHQLIRLSRNKQLVVNKKVAHINRFIGFQIFKEFFYIFHTLLQ